MNKLGRSLASAIACFAIVCAFPGFASETESSYVIGQGWRAGSALTIGGYFSAEYEQGDTEHAFAVDDLALLIYGHTEGQFSYLLELESVNFYKADYEQETEEWNESPSVERFYGDYKLSDQLGFRFGKQITPIGYWNLQPINVLRETTSNPRFSRDLFPKFLTGLDAYGFTTFDDDLSYHLFFQATEDLDDSYINIATDQHIGATLEKQFDGGLSFGGGFGEFDETSGVETRYLTGSFRFQEGPVKLQGEAMIQRSDLPGGLRTHADGAYLQGEYHFNGQHALISRYEYFRDQRTATNEQIGIVGYSYRPIYPVSWKVEYQWHSDSADNKVLASFSVLF